MPRRARTGFTVATAMALLLLLWPAAQAAAPAATPATAQYVAAGDMVLLSPMPAPGWRFAGWTGPDASRISGNTVKLTSDIDITAVFEPIVYSLTITVQGNGAVQVAESQHSTVAAVGAGPVTAAPQAPPESITNAVDGSAMILVPAGKYVAGKDKILIDLPSYYISLTFVTNAQYAAFLSARRPDPAELQQWIALDGSCGVRNTGGAYGVLAGRETYPVEQVSWYGATAYCEWAGLRLPSELEWEKAARGTDGRIYPWGSEWDPAMCENAASPKPVGTVDAWAFPAGRSPWGVYQMAGNVWQWCADTYDPNAYARYATGDLTPPATGPLRVMKGGSYWWGEADGYLRSDSRDSGEPRATGPRLGFRCAKSL